MSKNQLRAFVAVICIGLGGSLYHWNYTRSPKYSMLSAMQAIQQHDLTRFEKYVDIDSVSIRLVDQLMPSEGLAALMKPQIANMLKQQIANAVEKGNDGTATTGGTKNSFPSVKELYGNTVGDTKFKGFDYIRTEGAIANIGLAFHRKDYDATLVFNLKMRNKGSYWQVAELSNFDKIIEQLNALEAARIQKLNAPITAAINQAMTIESFKPLINRYLNRQVLLAGDVTFKNIGNKPIVGCVLAIMNANHEVLLSVRYKNKLMPGRTAKQDLLLLLGWDHPKRDALAREAVKDRGTSLTCAISKINFEDGSELKLIQN